MNARRTAWRGWIPLALGGLAALVVVGLALRWQDLWLRWCRGKAAEECLDAATGREGPPGPCWAELLAAHRAAYPHLAAILRDPRRQIWQRATIVIDAWEYGGEGFAAYLRRTDRLAALRYTFGTPCGIRKSAPPAQWRTDAHAEHWTGTWHAVWSGGALDHLEPFEAGIDDLEAMVLAPTDKDCSEGVKRAVRALAAMLRPGEADAPASPRAERIRSLLERVASSDPDPEVRLTAIHGLLLRSEPAARLAVTAAHHSAHGLLDWWEMAEAVRIGPRLKAGTRDETVPGVSPGHWQHLLRTFAHPWSLAALAYLDHPHAVCILELLRSDAAFRDEIDPLFESPPAIARLRLSPRGPPGEAVGRLLGGGAKERRLAAALAAVLNLRELSPRLAQAAQETSDAVERGFFEATLLALGEEGCRSRVRGALSMVLASGSPLPLLPTRYEFGGSSSLEEKDRHLIRCLLLAGDFEVLTQLIQSHKAGLVQLEDHVEGLPEDVMDSERYFLGDAGITTSSAMGNAYPVQLQEWWRRTRPMLSWDPVRRKFRIAGTEE